MHIGTSNIKHQTSDDGDSDTYQITYYSTRRRISPKARSSRIRGKKNKRRGEGSDAIPQSSRQRQRKQRKQNAEVRKVMKWKRKGGKKEASKRAWE